MREDGIKFTFTSEGRPTGECFVVLESEADLEEAMKRHNQHIGHRYIEGIHVTFCSQS